MPVIKWLVSLPVWLTFLVVIAFWMSVATILWWLVKTFVPREKVEKHKDSTYRVLVVISSFYAFLLGFVVSQEWSNVNSVRNDVARASAKIYIGGYNAEALPAPSGQKAFDALQNFASSLVCDDFPSLASGAGPSKKTGLVLQDAFTVVTRLPSNAQDAPSYSSVLRSVEDASEARRQWISSAADGLPSVILAIILLVALFLLSAFSLQLSASHRGHLLTLLGIAVFIGLGTGLVISLNRPFRGAAQVSTAPFTQNVKADTINCAKEPSGSAPSSSATNGATVSGTSAAQ